jgi:hypothetical protein
MRKSWSVNPHSGGQKISPAKQDEVRRRIQAYAEAHFAGMYTHLDIRFKGQFCYIDAFTEPMVLEGWPPPDWPETREEHHERLRNTPTHLCRLRYFGNDTWSFAFFTYSHEKYEPSVFATGNWFGTPEEAFDISAGVYLADR